MRAKAAERALLGFAHDFGEIDSGGRLGRFAGQNIEDLMVDIAHYCDRSRLNLVSCIATARDHYLEETASEGSQFRD